MQNNIIVRLLLLPFALVFSGIISLRNIFYETGLLKATSFNLPVINVGNLSVGGTGKTPHIEYLIRLLSPYLHVATLSRGYKRRSKGFRLVEYHDNASIAGDEPLQFKKKFPQVPVAVSESRNIGIPLLLKSRPDTQCILLDDAFQHRSVVPGLNILLTEYDNLFTDDYLLPAGRLREPRSSYVRADIIIVSKCPAFILPERREEITKKIKPYRHQKLLFSKYKYGIPYFLLDRDIRLELTLNTSVHVLSAVANIDYMISYLYDKCRIENTIKYEDHHYFSEAELESFKKIKEANSDDGLVFLTTEKDATRLLLHTDYILKHQLPFFVLPVEVQFLNKDNTRFDSIVKQFLLNFKV